MISKPRRAFSLGAAMLLVAGMSTASPWNERTILEFSEPVMVPGATLPAGTYVFQLADPMSSSHLVQITSEDGSKVFATTQAVPIKRQDPEGENVLKFDPTDAGSPPAIKAWFYPGSLYGHEFVYSGEQARAIAERTRTIALGIDMEATGEEKGRLRVYDETGPGEWKADESTMREWQQWRAGAAGPQERDDATAPMVSAEFRAPRIELNALEQNPEEYIGKTVSVDAEVEEVFGPRLFKIDERNWMDLDGELLVYVPTAAAVSEGYRVTVTGELQPFAQVELEEEWALLDWDPTLEVELSRRPVLVASRIVGGNNDVAMVLHLPERPERMEQTTGTAAETEGSAAEHPITDLSTIAEAGVDMVGRRVELKHAEVGTTAEDLGFWIEAADGDRLLVLPTGGSESAIQEGRSVAIEGIVLQMPETLSSRLRTGEDSNLDVYLLATSIDEPTGTGS